MTTKPSKFTPFPVPAGMPVDDETHSAMLSWRSRQHIDPYGLSTIDDVCAFFHISRRTWLRWEKDGTAPVRPVYLNSQKRYRNHEVIECLADLSRNVA